MWFIVIYLIVMGRGIKHVIPRKLVSGILHVMTNWTASLITIHQQI